MQKAAEDLRNEAKAKAVEKEKYINEKVPPLKTEGMVQGMFFNLMSYSFIYLQDKSFTLRRCVLRYKQEKSLMLSICFIC